MQTKERTKKLFPCVLWLRKKEVVWRCVRGREQKKGIASLCAATEKKREKFAGVVVITLFCRFQRGRKRK